MRLILFASFVILMLTVVIFSRRASHSFLLLRSAYELGAPDVSSIRPWMTLRYIAETYRVPETALRERLGLPSASDPHISLRALARQRNLSPLQDVQRVQHAIVELRGLSPPPSAGASETASWFGTLGEELMASLLVYGYPALGLTLLLGAVGVPLPSGLSMVVAGALAVQGHLSWWWASAVAVTTSVLGDVTGYSERNQRAKVAEGAGELAQRILIPAKLHGSPLCWRRDCPLRPTHSQRSIGWAILSRLGVHSTWTRLAFRDESGLSG